LASVDGLGVSGPSWLRILYYLVKSPKTPTEIANLENKHLSSVSRTLRELRSNGLVVYTDSGSRERYYRATQQGAILLRNALR